MTPSKVKVSIRRVQTARHCYHPSNCSQSCFRTSYSQKDPTVNGKENHGQEAVHEENTKSCEHGYGSYCLWSTEHRELMKDAIVKRLNDQLFMERAHYPSVAKLKQQERFTCELKQNIQELERMLSDTITDADLPPFFAEKLGKMEHTIERAESCEVGCLIVERKLRQLLDITEDEAYFHTRQSAFLYHLGVQTTPKTHHCLNMRLTVEYSYLETTVCVTYIEDNQKLSKDVDSLEMQQLWPAEEFRVTILNHSEPSQRQMKTEYICIFGHSSFLFPDLPTLNRVVVLDNDLIVQKKLLSLWNLDMGSKVIGAVQFW